ncbi:flagellar export chaperone FliS [Thiomicrorhabdus sp. 6S2-11]|jgi:flagellar protein FliS|uniref:Flagellar secretion chaperone FliS n=1 Tax=Thiomicrorhabdus marina TaxID=2818442 RepID=A0ABS3Q8C2_9GAMM|nr:flagellar export chaperone FliS [Thiomicrorhabdus marina]MBO1928383.1 flagellar export chaperone FliS [Thiomicrorhabdus marina]
MTYAAQNKMAQQYAKNFVETAVTEASPHKLVELLYSALLKNLKLAKVFIEQKNYPKKAEFSNKAIAIINELRAGVDLESGGEVAENLYSLYDYCYRTVFMASTQNDVQKIDEVVEHITGLQEAWQQMPEDIKRASKEQIQRVN